MFSRQFLIGFLTLFFISQCIYSQREVTELSSGWKFFKGNNDQAFQTNFDDSAWQNISIPHDWAIEGPFIKDGDGNTGKLPWKGEGWYRKNMQLPDQYMGKRLYLLFDGIMAFPKVYINGKLAGSWDYGYNSFYLDITDLIQTGKNNLLAVHVDTRKHDSRWYPGAGIYRKVQLVAVDPVHVELWGTHITTPIIKPHYADVRTSTSIKNTSSEQKEVIVKNTIYSKENSVLKVQRDTLIIPGNSQRVAENTITLSNPLLWDTEHPHLYVMGTEVYSNNKLLDATKTIFGVREIRFTADHGLYLNNKRVQLKGVNLHHDLGALGSAFNYRAMQRQLEIMKEMGCNAIRTSHNSPAPELLDLCDEMGLLVIDEVFDKYDGKADITDTTDFEDFAQRNIKNFITRDRNHPSIFLWSVGNEMGEVQWNINNGFQKLQTMINQVKMHDNSRPVTMVNDQKESAKMRHFDMYDVHSWNYGRRYSLARQIETQQACDHHRICFNSEYAWLL
ncbi:MAG: glycoside hydrolase family 2 TIM barrel-domain containing protein [Flavobacteriaceae bacterium]|nr:glycoside hydrolase family 2 TIM barrel-domain containing protein [Flavobacteriaceae bacterium]